MRRVLPLLAIAAIGVAAACEPVKKHPLKDTPPPGQNIAFYWAEEGGEEVDPINFRKSASPLSGPLCTDMAPSPGEVSQMLTADGSVVLAIDGPTSCNGTLGFAVEAGLLGDLETVSTRTTTGSDHVFLFFAFDVDGDGDYGGEFDADGNGTGFGLDVICLITVFTPIGGGTATVDETTSLDPCMFDSGMSGPHTLPALEAGAVAGVDSSTPLAVLAGTSSGGGGGGSDDVAATVDSLTINGVEKL